MPEIDNFDVKTETHPEDNNKAISTIKGGETAKNKNTPNLEVSTTTKSLPGDPTKTETVITSASGNKVKLKVVGPFNGDVEVESGTVLKDALAQLNSEEKTYGQFKYRDEQDNTVGITSVVSRDMVLISVHKG